MDFVGRLATYKYYNMDEVTAQALTLFDEIAARGDGPRVPAPRPTGTRKATLPSPVSKAAATVPAPVNLENGTDRPTATSGDGASVDVDAR